jgi:MFS family permease
MSQAGSKKSIRIFAAASFLNDLGSDIIYPIWPLFVTSILGANMAVLGFIDGLGDAVVSISQAFSGYFSDRMGRRKIFIVVGYLMGSLSRIGYALSAIWQHLIPMRILDRAGKIRSAPRDAIVADLSDKNNRGANFGLLRAMDNLGALCGILVSVGLMSVLGIRTLFLLAAIPSALGAIMIYAFIKEEKKDKSKIFKGLKLKNLDGNYYLFLVLSSIFSLGSFSYSFLLIYAKEAGFAMTIVPVFYLLFTAVAFLLSMPFGKLSDKIGRKKTIMISFLLWGMTCLIFILSRAPWAIVLSFIFYGAHKGALESTQKAFVSELAPMEYRASALGGFQMAVGLCALPASLIAGALWEIWGPAAPFGFSIILTAASIIILLPVREC